MPAKLAIRINHLVPGLVGRALMLANRILPGPAGAEGDRRQQGRESESIWTDSFATALTERAAVANNER